MISDKYDCGDTAISSDLVVVHAVDGTLIKGTLELTAPSHSASPPWPLPESLRIKRDSHAEAQIVSLRETKVIFFVKHHEGNGEQQEVKFFSELQANDLWVQVRFADGEVLEGRAENSLRLLLDPGIWLRPFDSTANNILVYIPKSSAVDFHIMGVALPRPVAVRRQTS